MKKQINPTIKAYLIRSAFYVLLLLAVCVIPFALAQRNATKRSTAKPVAKPNAVAIARLPQDMSSLDGTVRAQSQPSRARAPAATDSLRPPSLPRTSQVPLTNSGVIGAHAVRIPPPPKAPQVVLYDQYDNPGTNATLSATFDDFPTFSSDLADDFVVPAGETWNVESIDADGVYFNGFGPAFDWNVFIYTDSGGLPGTQIFSALNQPVSVVGTTFTVNLPVAAVLAAGTYWIEIQANMDFANQGEWGWTDRTVQSNNPAAWQNPGGGFGVCPTWAPKLAVCVPTASGPDQVYRINGTTGGGCPSIVNGGFETGDFTGWTILNADNVPVVTTNQAHSGTFSAFMGDSVDGFCGFGTENPGDSSIYQELTVPAGGATLDFWYWTCTVDSIVFDWQDAYITDTSGNILLTIFHQCTDNEAWVEQTQDLAAFAGQTVRVEFLVHTDAAGDLTGMYVDDVTLQCGAPTPTPTPTPTGSPTCAPGWQNEPNMLASRAFASGAVASNAFYVLTGFNGSGYEIASDYFNGSVWTKGAPIPTGHSQSKAAAVGDNIYVPGGFNSIQFGGPINLMQIYDTVANTWSNGMNLPIALSGPATAAFNGKVYIIGGFTDPFPTATNNVYEYDPVLNTYTTKTPMPAPSGNIPGAVLGNEIFVVGGSSPTTVAFAYNPTTDTWRPITAPSPADCQAGGAFALNGQLWLVGCLGQPGTNSKIYDPNSDSWSAGPPLNTSQEGGSATSVYNALGFVAGGAAGGGASTTVEAVGTCGTPTPTPTPSGTPVGCQFNVLIVSSDVDVNPVMLHDQIAAEPDVVAVDYFDALNGTPTLAQLQPYNIVVSFSNSAYFDPVAMGDVLADYADTGGTVVGFMFNWFGPPFDLEGRWQTDGYSPFVDGVGSNFGTNCLGTYDMTHPLMQGISAGSLCSGYWGTLALTPGAVSVAEYQDGEHLCAYQVHNGHTGVGINAYVGDFADSWSGPFGRVVVNAGRWVGNCQGGTPTPTPTPTPITPTPTPTPTPVTPTPTPTPTPITPTPTPTPTPSPTRPPPTPRPRPTPFPRPTP